LRILCGGADRLCGGTKNSTGDIMTDAWPGRISRASKKPIRKILHRLLSGHWTKLRAGIMCGFRWGAMTEAGGAPARRW
jgi:hypothetical protein